MTDVTFTQRGSPTQHRVLPCSLRESATHSFPNPASLPLTHLLTSFGMRWSRLRLSCSLPCFASFNILLPDSVELTWLYSLSSQAES